MPEATTARTTGSGDSMMTNYQINDAALKSSRTGRLPGRHGSNNSNKSGGNVNVNVNNANANSNANTNTTTTLAGNTSSHHPQDTSRFSQASSTSSSWRGWMGRVRRIHGSAASVASSITLTEFGSGVFSEDFSEGSLDYHHLDTLQELPTTTTDYQPQLPQRHASVAAGQSSSLLSTTSHSSNPPPSSAASRVPSSNLPSSDLSPRQPGRKLSIQTPVSTGDDANTNTNTNTTQAPFGRSISNDTVPQYPRRRQSSAASNELPDLSTLFQEAIRDKDTFSGEEAITKMIEAHMIETRQEGLQVGQVLLNDNVFSGLNSGDNTEPPTTTMLSFCDSTEAMYVLLPTQPPPSPPSTVVVPSPGLLSVRRKMDTSICIEEESPLQEETAKQIDVPHVMMKR
jgi:hypothetical protein